MSVRNKQQFTNIGKAASLLPLTETVATREMLRDERALRASTRRLFRRHQTSRAGTNRNEIVNFLTGVDESDVLRRKLDGTKQAFGWIQQGTDKTDVVRT